MLILIRSLLNYSLELLIVRLHPELLIALPVQDLRRTLRETITLELNKMQMFKNWKVLQLKVDRLNQLPSWLNGDYFNVEYDEGRQGGIDLDKVEW